MFPWKKLLWPRNKIREIRSRFDRATPYRKFEMIRIFADTLLRISGINILNDCTWRWRAFCNHFFGIQFICFALYTSYYYWNENMITAVQPYTLLALIIPVIAFILFYFIVISLFVGIPSQRSDKLQGHILVDTAVGSKKHRYRAIALFARSRIFMDRRPSNEYERKCDQLANELIILVICSIAMILISYNLIIVGPVYVFVVSGQFVAPTGVIVPFLDPNTTLSSSINLSIQFPAAFMALLDTIGLTTVTCFIIITCTSMAELICCNMRKFSDGLRPGRFTVQQKEELRQIIVRLNDLEAYIGEFNDIFYWRS